ncbi:MAG: class I SAM-dependent methyltransferase [Planctomycetota bacterium]|nr:class I SAM-dependent methyltransferase [Planctomycetota bacterium]
MAAENFEFLYKGKNIPLAIDLDDLNDPRTKMILLTRANAKVLEFGCNTGFCSKALADRGCEVTGIEIDPVAAEHARRFCKKVIVADIENGKFQDQIGSEKFDNILLGGFLEHLKSPGDFLRRMRPLLEDAGSVILYVPNIAHWSTRIELLEGRFDYQLTGILDSTHLVHFTKAGLLKMLEESRFGVIHLDSVVVPIDVEKVRDNLLAMGLSCDREIVNYFKSTDAESYIYVAEAKPLE